ncbi:iron ABC transporter ATP-binding protein [Leucobacter sp. UCD-THU]|uniref:ABC transporter ATP-binding protein n=1 Tax=Leucobacter sp. UCD-THU TaxID=1292023 RepID=UPI00036AEE6C|nr:ABC transporter ATP-binding protein [Leucobacter sp. UCD-THU]EYT52026.1 iron ABC transporter ATP-binding protein [Leucobacter sp. UCD-THU]
MSTILRILRFTRSLTPYYLSIMAAAAVVTAAGIAVPFITGAATDTVVDAVGSVTNGSGIPDGAIRSVVLLALALLAASLVETVASNLGGYWGDVMSERMRTILSTRYFEQLLALPQRYYDSELTGTIVARLNRSIAEITGFMKSFSNMFVTMLMTTVAVLAISAWHYWPLAVLLLLAYPAYLWLTALTSRKWQRIEREKNEHVDEASGRFAEVVGQIRVVKSFARERSELDRFSDHFGETVRLTSEQSRHWHSMDALRRGVLNLIFFALYVIIFVRTVTGHFTPGEMVMLIQLMAMARQPVQNLSWVVDTAQRAAAGSRSYFEVMDLDPAAVGGAGSLPRKAEAERGGGRRGDETDPGSPHRGGADASGASGSPGAPGSAPVVAFRDVSFGYDEHGDVLSGVSFEVRQGERIAFVGESGGGKTTLINLLLGLYAVRSGTIEVAGAGPDLASLRRSIGVVFQDPSLFSGTVAENIAYGRPEATRDEIEAVARRAAVDVFASKLPSGYDTVIGERGMKLSGGQKQRIAVARAMLKDAPILVLDEATSALDTKSERLVQAGLDDLMRHRTSLIIAHRLSTIAEVDRIITLRDGRIDEVGPPDELSRSGGIYAELLALQSSSSKADRKRLKRFEVIG